VRGWELREKGKEAEGRGGTYDLGDLEMTWLP